MANGRDVLDAAGNVAGWILNPMGRVGRHAALADVGNPELRKRVDPESTSDDTVLGDVLDVGEAARDVVKMLKNGASAFGPLAVIGQIQAFGASGDIKADHKALIEKLAEKGVPGFEVIRENGDPNGAIVGWVDSTGLAYPDGHESAYSIYDDAALDRDDRKALKAEIDDLDHQIQEAQVRQSTAITELVEAGFTSDQISTLINDGISGRDYDDWIDEVEGLDQFEELPGFAYTEIEVNGHTIRIAADGRFGLEDGYVQIYHDLSHEDLQALGPEGYLEALRQIEQRSEALVAEAQAELNDFKAQGYTEEGYDEMIEQAKGILETEPVDPKIPILKPQPAIGPGTGGLY